MDIAIIEVGLGGRLDATNVLTPEVAVITDISYDHTEILGDTLEEIAGEKAGIIKTGIPTVIGLLPKEAEGVIRETCRERRSKLIKLSPKNFSRRPDSLRFDFSSNGLSLSNFQAALIGNHQIKNCSLALKTIEVLRERGFRLPKTAVRKGLQTTDWPGRFQIMSNGRPGQTLVLDVCHNAAGAKAFAETFALRFPGRRCLMVIGFVKRKQHQEMIDSLSKITRHFQVVPLKTKRSMSVKELVEGLEWRNVPVAHSAKLESGYRRVLKLAEADDTICVIGSHYLVGEFLQTHGKR